MNRRYSLWPNGRPSGRCPGSPVYRLEDYPENSAARRFILRLEQRFQDLGGSVDLVRDTVLTELGGAQDLLAAFRLPAKGLRITSSAR